MLNKYYQITGDIITDNKVDLDRKRVYLSKILNTKLDAELIYTNNALARKVKCIVQDVNFPKA